MLSSVSGPMSCESVFSPSHTGKLCQIKLKKKSICGSWKVERSLEK